MGRKGVKHTGSRSGCPPLRMVSNRFSFGLSIKPPPRFAYLYDSSPVSSALRDRETSAILSAIRMKASLSSAPRASATAEARQVLRASNAMCLRTFAYRPSILEYYTSKMHAGIVRYCLNIQHSLMIIRTKALCQPGTARPAREQTASADDRMSISGLPAPVPACAKRRRHI